MNIRTHIIITISALLVLLASGCSDNAHDPRLTEIAQTVSDNPEEAISALDSINKKDLSSSDRHYYDLLDIKAHDKAYIDHTSDSLILDVIDYYSSHSDSPEYIESLYYGGRVYHDLGDYPTALKYYQKTLDCLDNSSENDELRSRINTQTGMVLKRLRLYEEAVPYVNEALDFFMAKKDSLNIVYSMQLLGSIYMDWRQSDKAASILIRSMDYAKNLPESFAARSRMFLAVVKEDKDDIQAALNLVRDTPEQVDTISRDAALSSAAYIYLNAGIPDTAFMYAHELIRNKYPLNQKAGYRIMLTTDFRHLLHPDTLAQYLDEYQNILEEYYSENSKELALMQESLYNYQMHERESREARKSNDRLRHAVLGFIFLVIVLAFVVLYQKYRNTSYIVKLHTALDNLEILKKDIKAREGHADDTGCGPNTSGQPDTDSENTLRERLRIELMALYEKSGEAEVPESILNSEVYLNIRSLLDNKKPMSGTLWDELEREVLKVSPNFINNLKVLTDDRLSEGDIHIALLIKCGFRLSELTVLLARSNGAIISRRDKLCVKILDKKLEVKVINGIIRLL